MAPDDVSDGKTRAAPAARRRSVRRCAVRRGYGWRGRYVRRRSIGRGGGRLCRRRLWLRLRLLLLLLGEVLYERLALREVLA